MTRQNVQHSQKVRRFVVRPKRTERKLARVLVEVSDYGTGKVNSIAQNGKDLGLEKVNCIDRYGTHPDRPHPPFATGRPEVLIVPDQKGARRIMAVADHSFKEPAE